MTPPAKQPSLIERAAEMFDFNAAFAQPPAPAPEQDQVPPPEVKRIEPAARLQAPLEQVAEIDRQRLQAAGFIVPEAPVSGLAEEFRIVKRQLLLGTRDEAIPADKRRSILVCSASPDEGKSFCAVNLALSMAGEKDIEVLLVDGDVNKPSVMGLLGLEDGPGLIDAMAEADANAEQYVIRTDVPGLSVLPTGRRVANATELLASARTVELLAELTARRPRRIVIFDSPPALMASPAGVLAAHVGQTIVVVRADATTEAELREAVSLLSGCERLSLLLNAAALSVPGRRFGSYYGLED